MAKLDIQTLNRCKALDQRQREETQQGLERYHYLRYLHSITTTPEEKKILVTDHPKIAAQVFYHFDDREMAKFLVKCYSAHEDSKLRELAFTVKDVLNGRKSMDNRLENVLGMQAVTIKTPERLNYFEPSEPGTEYFVGF